MARRKRPAGGAARPAAQEAPPPLPPLWLAGIAFACSFLLGTYLLSMSPAYTFGETSLLAAACASFGVGHPPGFPLYVLTCAPVTSLVGWLGFEPALGASFASAVAAVAACACLAWLLLRTGVHGAVAASVAAAFGLSASLWSQAVIQQVHALHVLLFAATLLVAHLYAEGGGRRRLFLLSLLAGLGLSHNWPLFVLCLPVPLLWLVPARGRIAADLGRGGWAGCLGAFAAGLAPYLHLAFPPQSGSSYLGFDLPEQLIQYSVLGQYTPYLSLDQHPRWDVRQLNGLAAALAMLRDMTWLGGALGLAGVYAAARRFGSWRLAALAWGILVPTYLFGLYRPHGVDITVADAHFRSAALTAHFLYAFLAAHGLAMLLGAARDRWGERMGAGAARMLPALAVLLPAAALALNRAGAVRVADDVAVRYAKLVQGEVDPDKLLLVSPTSMDFPLLYDPYLTEGGERRAELVHDYLDRVGPKPDIDRLALYLGREEREAVISPFVPFDLRLSKFHGAYFTVGAFPVEETIEASEDALGFIRHASLLRDSVNSAETVSFIDRVVYRFCLTAQLLEGVEKEGFTPDPRYMALMEELAGEPGCRYPRFLLGSLEVVARGDVETVAANLEAMGDQSDMPAEWRIEALSILARTQVEAGESEEALLTLGEALRLTSSTPARAIPLAMLAIHAREGDFESYARLRRRHPELDPAALAGTDAQCRSNLGRSCLQ